MLVQGYISLPFPNTLNLPKQAPFKQSAHIQHGGNSGNAKGEQRSRSINSTQSKDKFIESLREEHHFYCYKDIGDYTVKTYMSVYQCICLIIQSVKGFFLGSLESRKQGYNALSQKAPLLFSQFPFAQV